MSLLLRAAVLGGIAYFITRSMRGSSSHRRATGSATPYRSGSNADSRSEALGELQPGENHVWPTSPSQQPTSVNAGPGA